MVGGIAGTAGAGQQALLHAGIEHRLPGRRGAQGEHDLGPAGVLGQVATRAGLERVEDRGVIGVSGQDHDLRLRMRGTDPPRRLDTVDAGHAQVEQRDVRTVLPHQRARLLAVGGRGHHLDPVGEAEQRHEPLADDGLVVRHDDAKRRRAHAGTVTLTVKTSPSSCAVSSPPTSPARSRMPVMP